MDIASEGGGLASLIAPILKPLATGLEFFGVGVILIGVAVATVGYIHDLTSAARREAYDRYRAIVVYWERPVVLTGNLNTELALCA